MTKIRIHKKDGTPTQYFWVNRDSGDRTSATVFKRTSDGVKRMKGVRYNAVTKQMLKD